MLIISKKSGFNDNFEFSLYNCKTHGNIFLYTMLFFFSLLYISQCVYDKTRLKPALPVQLNKEIFYYLWAWASTLTDKNLPFYSDETMRLYSSPLNHGPYIKILGSAIECTAKTPTSQGCTKGVFILNSNEYEICPGPETKQHFSCST